LDPEFEKFYNEAVEVNPELTNQQIIDSFFQES
jgi:hypothetical protein